MDTKPYRISKSVVWEAWTCVKANKGAPGVDGQTVEGFERKLKDNLYKLWNRMSSGSYFGKPVRLCEIPKVGVARQRCWQFDWVIDLDIQGFFDSIDHGLMLGALRKYTAEPWLLLYVERWLKAPGQGTDGKLAPRDRGTPQGGVISPLLANIFLHEAFDRWMQEEFPTLPFVAEWCL